MARSPDPLPWAVDPARVAGVAALVGLGAVWLVAFAVGAGPDLAAVGLMASTLVVAVSVAVFLLAGRLGRQEGWRGDVAAGPGVVYGCAATHLQGPLGLVLPRSPGHAGLLRGWGSAHRVWVDLPRQARHRAGVHRR